MNSPKVFWFSILLIVFQFYVNSNLGSQSESQDFKITADVLDEFGGPMQSANYFLRVSSGGQPGVVGISGDSSFHAQQGYVHTVTFLHGDANNDGRVSVGDVIFMINCLFRGGDCPDVPEVGDVNCDGKISIGDIVYLINYLFKGGPPPCNK